MKLKWVVRMTGQRWGRDTRWGHDLVSTPDFATQYNTRDAAEAALVSYQHSWSLFAPVVRARRSRRSLAMSARHATVVAP